jgi:hypothetical protein
MSSATRKAGQNAWLGDENQPSNGQFETPRSEIDDRLNLLTIEAVVPAEHVVHAGASLEVLEDRRDGHARARQNPGAAHLAWNPLDGRTLRPVQDSHGGDQTAPLAETPQGPPWAAGGIRPQTCRPGGEMDCRDRMWPSSRWSHEPR